MVPETLPHDSARGQVDLTLFREYLELRLGSQYPRAEAVFPAYWDLNVFSGSDFTFKVANVLYMASQVDTTVVEKALGGLEEWADTFPLPVGWHNLYYEDKIVRCADTQLYFNDLYGRLFDIRGAFSPVQPGEQRSAGGLIIPHGVQI